MNFEDTEFAKNCLSHPKLKLAYNEGMLLTSRPSAYIHDRDAVCQILITYRAATSVFVYPTKWRIKLLWSSRVWEPKLDTRIWLDEKGRVLGFAMIWRRVRMGGNLVLERIVHPEFVNSKLVGGMLAWGVGRANQIVAKHGKSLKLFTSSIAPSIYAREDLRAYGFSPNPPNPEAHNLYFRRDLGETIPAYELSAGHKIRTLNDEADLLKYGELYGFAVVDTEHRRELLASDEYSVLVLEDNTGAFAAYCESSICQAEWELSGDRVGWIDYIETSQERRGKGLGRAILLASLARMQGWEADTAMLVTISSNIPAIKLYQSAGFTQVEVVEAPSYQMEIQFGVI